MNFDPKMITKILATFTGDLPYSDTLQTGLKVTGDLQL